MTKDPRYKTIQKLILADSLKSFRELFELEIIPKSVVARDLGISLDRFDKMIADVGRFNAGKLFRLAGLIEVEEKQVMNLICNQYLLDKKKKR